MKAFGIACTIVIATILTVGGGVMAQSKEVLLPIKNDPTVSFKLWFKVGSQNDPKGKEGLSYLTAQMLTDASTTNNSYEQILDKLFPLASSYSAQSGVEMTVISGRTHTDNLDEFYSLYKDAVMSPAFTQEDLDRIKSQVLNYLENTLRYASDEELGKAVLYSEIFAGTPYAHVPSGLVSSVSGITVDDIRSFYQSYYTRENVVIGLGGGYDDALLQRVRKDVAMLPAGKPAQVPAPTPKSISGLEVTIVEKDAASTAISFGFPGMPLRGTKDWYALAIANSWLGEHRNSSSHLYQVIREERGLNYGDYSYIEHFPNGGSFQLPPQNAGRRQQIFEIWIRPVPNEARHFALRAAVRELSNLVANGMSESDFTLTRNFLKKYVLHFASTTMERLGYAIDDAFYGMKESHLDKYRAMMDAMTLQDVNAAIKKYWQAGNLQIAIVTNDAESLKAALIADSPSPITYATPKPDAVMAEDKEISVFPMKVNPDRITVIPVAELFER